jgi:hypothetical protein
MGIRKIPGFIWQRFRTTDQSVHSWVLAAFPKTMSAIDTVLETLFQTFGHPVFGVIVTLLLVALVATNVIPKVVAVSVGAAWLIAVVWLAQLAPVKCLTVISRWVLILVGGAVFAVAANSFGKWAVAQYQKQRKADLAESQRDKDFPAQPTAVPSDKSASAEKEEAALAPVPKKKASKLPDSQPEIKPANRASNSDNVTEGFWFGIHMEASKTVRDEFWALDEKYLGHFRGSGSLNTIDRLPPEYIATGWASTFMKLLLCGEEGISSSAISFVVSEHPQMAASMANSAYQGKCSMRATVFVPHTGLGVTLAGPDPFPPHQYILEFPVWGEKNSFGLRFHMWSEELKQLNQGYLPLWKSFAIDDANEKIDLQISRKGPVWTPVPRLEQCLSNKILLRTGLESGGPWIVREYKLVSNKPHQIGRGDDASQIFIWAFTWQRTGYGEQLNALAGADGKMPPGLQLHDIR